MISASEMFIYERELSAQIGHDNARKHEADITEYKRGLKFPDKNVESEMMMQEELEREPFANDLYEREEGLS